MECNLSKKTRKSNKLIQSHDIKFIHSSMGHGMEKKNLAKLSQHTLEQLHLEVQSVLSQIWMFPDHFLLVKNEYRSNRMRDLQLNHFLSLALGTQGGGSLIKGWYS